MLPKLRWNPPGLKRHIRGSHNFISRKFFQKNTLIKFSPPWVLEGLSQFLRSVPRTLGRKLEGRSLREAEGSRPRRLSTPEHSALRISYCVGVAWHLGNVFIREADTKTKEFWESGNKAERSVVLACEGTAVEQTPEEINWDQEDGSLAG